MILSVEENDLAGHLEHSNKATKSDAGKKLNEKELVNELYIGALVSTVDYTTNIRGYIPL